MYLIPQFDVLQFLFISQWAQITCNSERVKSCIFDNVLTYYYNNYIGVFCFCFFIFCLFFWGLFLFVFFCFFCVLISCCSISLYFFFLNWCSHWYWFIYTDCLIYAWFILILLCFMKQKLIRSLLNWFADVDNFFLLVSLFLHVL